MCVMPIELKYIVFFLLNSMHAQIIMSHHFVKIFYKNYVIKAIKLSIKVWFNYKNNIYHQNI